MSIKTDSTPVEDAKDPTNDNVFALLKLFASDQETAEWDARYRKGGMGYGDAKKRLFELFEERFAGPRARRAELLADPSFVDDVLHEGGKKARKVAQQTMAEVLSACGLATSRFEIPVQVERHLVACRRRCRVGYRPPFALQLTTDN